jgi:hypothetical protein
LTEFTEIGIEFASLELVLRGLAAGQSEVHLEIEEAGT